MGCCKHVHRRNQRPGHSVRVARPDRPQIGLDGVILLAFILGLPANEIVIPIALMSYLSTGMMIELDSASAMHEVFVSKGWTLITALNFMLFSVLHFPAALRSLRSRAKPGVSSGLP